LRERERERERKKERNINSESLREREMKYLFKKNQRSVSGGAPLGSPSTSRFPASKATVPVHSSAVSRANRAGYFSSEKDQIRAATLLSLGGHRSDLVTDKDEVSAETLSRQYWVSFLVKFLELKFSEVGLNYIEFLVNRGFA
jgi:hypothetical protein